MWIHPNQGKEFPAIRELESKIMIKRQKKDEDHSRQLRGHGPLLLEYKQKPLKLQELSLL